MSDEKSPDVATSLNFERHLQTVLLSILTGLLAWNYTTTQAAQVDLASLSAQTEALRADVNKLQATLEKTASDRFTGAQAQTAHAVIDVRIDRLEARVLELERRK